MSKSNNVVKVVTTLCVSHSYKTLYSQKLSTMQKLLTSFVSYKRKSNNTAAQYHLFYEIGKY